MRLAISELCPGDAHVWIKFKFATDDDLLWPDTNRNPKPAIADVLAKGQEIANAEPLQLLRGIRNRRLEESDWMGNQDVTMSDEWKAYRQKLRDLPASSDPYEDEEHMLKGVTWPTPPE